MPASPITANFPAAAEVAPSASEFSALPAEVRTTLAPIARLWPQLAPSAHARLLANARQWQALDARQRQELQQRIRQWDAQPAPARARRRAVYAHWQWLVPSERVALEHAATSFSALTPMQQQSLRVGFAGLPDDARDLWSQGPALGRALPALAPLFEFVPADERDALLAIVRVLTPALRTALAERIATMPRPERERLRRTLIATAPDGYAAVIAGGDAQ